ncbi:MAG: Uma2 family endonuclease [Verrucomicrobiae bacterium]|nr:Uma2 family endonuclease [Verrucomicrobiae bacterium]
MGAEKYDLVSVEDYLAAEETSEVKHEYLAGLVYAMSGASRAHNVIAGNIYVFLRESLKGNPCEAYMSDVRLHITSTNTGEVFYYPDVVVTCDPDDNDTHRIERPSVIFEVLSESTERVDRREKRLYYQHIPNLKQYVLIAQDEAKAESLILGEEIKEEAFESLDATLPLPSLALEIPLRRIYEGIFPQP